MSVVSSNRYKQRKKMFNLPWNLAIKLMSAPLSKELQARLNIKSIPVRVNDTVKIVSGGFKGRSGKVTRIDVKRRLVFVEGITGKAQKGKTKLVGIHVANLMITKLDLSDKYRKLILQRKGVSAELLEKEPEIGGEESRPTEESTPAEQPSQEESKTKSKEVESSPSNKGGEVAETGSVSNEPQKGD